MDIQTSDLCGIAFGAHVMGWNRLVELSEGGVRVVCVLYIKEKRGMQDELSRGY